jgi:hypothetical protein
VEAIKVVQLRPGAVTAGEDIVASASWNASRRFPQLAEMTGPYCAGSFAIKCFRSGASLGGLEVIARRLFKPISEDWRRLLPVVESLLAAGVSTEWHPAPACLPTLERR